jgi:hypothetical protein
MEARSAKPNHKKYSTIYYQLLLSTTPLASQSTDENTTPTHFISSESIIRSTMEGVQNLPPHMQGEFMKTLEQMQIKDSLM